MPLLQRALLTSSVFIVLCFFGAMPAYAVPVVINFENFNLGGQEFISVASPLVFANAGGSGVNVTIVAGSDLRVVNLLAFGGNPAVTGQALIDFPFPAGSNTLGTTILFDQPVSNFSLRAGDFGNDDDSPLTIIAFDINNLVIGSASVPWPGTAFPPFATLSVNGDGIRRIVFTSGGTFANSTFIDDLTFNVAPVAAIPEPATMLLLGTGLAGLAAKARRCRKARKENEGS